MKQVNKRTLRWAAALSWIPCPLRWLTPWWVLRWISQRTDLCWAELVVWHDNLYLHRNRKENAAGLISDCWDMDDYTPGAACWCGKYQCDDREAPDG